MSKLWGSLHGDGTESPETTIKKLEQRNKDLNRDLHGQKTEGKDNGRNNMTPADEADLNGEDVLESTFVVSEEEFSEVMDVVNSARKNAVKSNGRKKGQKVPQRPQPLKARAREIFIEPMDKPEGATLCKGESYLPYRTPSRMGRVYLLCVPQIREGPQVLPGECPEAQHGQVQSRCLHIVMDYLRASGEA